MNSKTPSPTPSSVPTALCRRPPSLEMTPDEFDHFVEQAHRMRSETVAAFVSGRMAGLARLFARAKFALRPRAPVPLPVKRRQAHSA